MHELCIHYIHYFYIKQGYIELCFNVIILSGNDYIIIINDVFRVNNQIYMKSTYYSLWKYLKSISDEKNVYFNII